MADHPKVQAALDTSVALAIAKMNENIYASLLNEIETNVHLLLEGSDLDNEDDRILLTTYHEEFVKMCGIARDAQGRVHAAQKE